MNFFGRKKEIEILRNERELSFENSRFTVVTGRRRIGKTELIGQVLNDGNDVAFREFPCQLMCRFSVRRRPFSGTSSANHQIINRVNLACYSFE